MDIKSTFGKYKGEIDVIIGGPPCQGFSQKGKRKSVLDERNFMFKYYYEVVKCVRPRYFVMENVPNLLTTEHGFFKEEIYNLFKEIGYTLNSDVLNASDYGVPQNRCRICVLFPKRIFNLHSNSKVHIPVFLRSHKSDACSYLKY